LPAKKKKKSRSRKQRPTFTVRRATVKDVPVLVSQRRAMWKTMGMRDKRALDETDQVYTRWVRSRMKNEKLMGWLAEAQGRIVGGGCVWLQPIQPMPGYNRMLQPYVLSMYTEPDFRGQGVASAIIDEASAWARKSKFPLIRLHAAEMGRGVYAKRGFKRGWEMRLRLSKPRSPLRRVFRR
jgi:GNAT superfamily N-acetyltransferase